MCSGKRQIYLNPLLTPRYTLNKTMTLSLPAFPATLANANTVAQFAAALGSYACDLTRAHGVRVWVIQEARPVAIAQEGRGLGLSDGSLVASALASGAVLEEGMLSALPFGCGVLEFVGADPQAVNTLAGASALLGLALEGVQAREARRGYGRIAETIASLGQRLKGSLNLPEVLTITAQSVALSLGF